MDKKPDMHVVIAGRIGLVILWLVVWEVVGRTTIPELLSYPTRVAAHFYDMAASNQLPLLLLSSARTFIVGWLLAVGIGGAVGIVIGWFRPMRLMFEPFINALYSTPLIVLIPLMVLWFGLEFKALVVCVTLVAVFPMLIMTMTGVRNASREFIEVARSFRLSRTGILFKVVLPGALPFIFVGLRLTTTRALTGTIIAEFLIPSDGIGTTLRSAGDSFDAETLYGLILVIVAAAMLLDLAVRRGNAQLAARR